MRKILPVLILLLAFPFPAHASEWAKNDGYFKKTAGKLGFGLKYILLSWSEPWLEANEPGYKREWEGFCVGLGKSVLYEAAGLIHTVTFPIPIDFPNISRGLHIPKNASPQQRETLKPKEPEKKSVVVVASKNPSDKKGA